MSDDTERAAGQGAPAPLRAEHLYDMFAGLEPPIDVGATPEGHRLVVMVNGGWFKGPRMSGRVVPASGGDWARIHADGSFDLDVRACLETGDGAAIYVTYRGRAAFRDAEQMQAVLAYGTDTPIDGSEYYFRINPVFETAHPDHAWLNTTLAVGRGSLGHGGVRYDVFALR